MAEDDAEEANSAHSPTIKVCVRVRPFIKEELDGTRCDEDEKCELCIEMSTETQVVLKGDGEKPDKPFEFDRCFWSHHMDHPLYATQATVFEELGTNLLEHAIGGFNNCIFAYGQTGSGKSFSVLGERTGEGRGLLPRIVQGLFDHFEALRAGGRACKCLVSFLEIYNEQLRDLLAQNTGKDGDSKLEVRTHPILGMIIPGLTEAAVGSCEEVMQLVDYGLTLRHVAETAMNASSSRSHCIFTFKTSIAAKAGAAKMSQTHLVDLAGSERTKRTRATGERLKEGLSINKSLSTLARVISMLAKNSKKSQPPFRDSKLTWLLKESLCGNSKTVMMAAIAPSTADYSETLSTLTFARSVKQVQTHAKVNEVNEQSVEQQLRSELMVLREKLMLYEAKRDSDARRLSMAHKRMVEQEKLCMSFGTDWESLLAAERRRNIHRMAVVNMDVADLQEKFAEFVKEAEETRSGTSADSDDSSDANSSCASEFCPVVDLAEALGPRAQQRTSLLYRCKKGSADGGEDRADRLTQSLKQLMAEVQDAEEAVEALTAPSSARCQVLRLHPMIAVDPGHGRNQLVICARREACVDTEASGDDDQELPPATLEWVSDEDFRARLAWLQEQQLQHDLADAARASGDEADTSLVLEDPWAEATAEAVGGTRALRAEVASLRAENATLRTQLAAVQAELADARRQEPSGAGRTLPGVSLPVEKLQASDDGGGLGGLLAVAQQRAFSAGEDMSRSLRELAAVEAALDTLFPRGPGESTANSVSGRSSCSSARSGNEEEALVGSSRWEEHFHGAVTSDLSAAIGTAPAAAAQAPLPSPVPELSSESQWM